MALKRVWNCNFAGPGSIPIQTAVGASAADRLTFGSYQPLIRYSPPGAVYGYTNSAWWNDNNHSQSERLYLPFIFRADGAAGFIPAGAKIAGGRFDVELCTNNLQLDKYVQIALLAQWDDPEANAGRGSNINYLRMLPTSIDEQLGYNPPRLRAAGGQELDAGWTAISIDFPVDDIGTTSPEDENGWLPIDGRPDKVAANVYHRAVDMERAYACNLLNLMIVCHCGQNVPTNQPPARIGGGMGEFYIRKAELWVEDALNPGLATV